MASLAAKSGNAIVLKGGSEARETNRVLSAIIARAGEAAGLPSDWLVALETREEIGNLLRLDAYVDLVIPRGSKGIRRPYPSHQPNPCFGTFRRGLPCVHS
jgi:Gamma-glutamyl phosphate reductase